MCINIQGDFGVVNSLLPFLEGDAPHKILAPYKEGSARGILPLYNHGGPVMATPGEKIKVLGPNLPPQLPN
jgi:hypothetical protein